MPGKKSIWYRYKLHHVLLWIGYYIFWAIPYWNLYPFWGLIAVITIYFVFTAPAFYITSYVLIPKLLGKRQYVAFFLSLVAVLLLLSVGLGVSLHYVFRHNLEAMKVPMSGYLMIGLVAISTMTGLFSGAKLLVDRIRSDRHNKLAEKQRLEAELQYLRAQVNPHFLFNAINSVYILIRKDPNQAADTLIKLSDLLRFQLYDTSGERISIEKEIEYLNNYIDLEKLRRGNRVEVSFEHTGVQGFMIAPLLLIPLLENTFKHISTGPAGENRITIRLSHDNGWLHASFVNTKDQIPVTQPGGIGIRNLTRRLEILYPGAHRLTFEDKSTSYSANLSVKV